MEIITNENILTWCLDGAKDDFALFQVTDNVVFGRIGLQVSSWSATTGILIIPTYRGSEYNLVPRVIEWSIDFWVLHDHKGNDYLCATKEKFDLLKTRLEQGPHFTGEWSRERRHYKIIDGKKAFIKSEVFT